MRCIFSFYDLAIEINAYCQGLPSIAIFRPPSISLYYLLTIYFI